MNWRCWFGHEWKVLNYTNRDCNHYENHKIWIKPSFILRYCCKNCHKIKVENFIGAGYLTNEQFYEIWEETNVER